MRRKRRLGVKPNPESRRCRTCTDQPELNSGLRMVRRLLIVERLFVMPKLKLVPVGYACCQAKSADVVCPPNCPMPVVGKVLKLVLKVETSVGSNDSTFAPVPIVEVTRPKLPDPA